MPIQRASPSRRKTSPPYSNKQLSHRRAVAFLFVPGLVFDIPFLSGYVQAQPHSRPCHRHFMYRYRLSRCTYLSASAAYPTERPCIAPGQGIPPGTGGQASARYRQRQPLYYAVPGTRSGMHTAPAGTTLLRGSLYITHIQVFRALCLCNTFLRYMPALSGSRQA